MMASSVLRFVYTAAEGQFSKGFDTARHKMAVALTGAAKGIAEERLKVPGRANIASAGFSKRWQNAFRVKVYPDEPGRYSLDPAIIAYHKIPYAGVFAEGATISGSPLLWLPLPNVPASVKGKHMSPKNFVQLVGPLHTIVRPGKPPLLAAYMIGGRGGQITVPKLIAGARAARGHSPGAPAAKVVSVPLFFGISKVTLAKRFNLQPIFDQAAGSWGVYYVRNMKT